MDFQNIKDVGILDNLPILLSLGYEPKDLANKIDIFARADIPSNKLVLISSMNNTLDVNNFKPYNDNSDVLSLVSSSTSDTHNIRIYYMNQSRELKEADIVLTGTTPIDLDVALGENPYMIWKMKNIDSVDNVGEVTIEDDSSNVYCNMPETSGIQSNNSLSSVFSVPKGYVGLIIYSTLLLDKGADAKGAIFTRKKDKVFIYNKALSSYQSQSTYQRLFLTIDEETDIMPIAFAQSGGIAYLDYQIILINKDYVGKHDLQGV